MKKPRGEAPEALDVYCGAGGASAGLVLAGFYPTGVDKKFQPRYPYFFVEQEAIAFLRSEKTWIRHNYRFIWASPPCQPYSRLAAIGNHWCRDELIEPTREALREIGLPYVIENVMGAPLINPIMLCGAMFGMRTYRHRIFEFSQDLSQKIVRPPHPRHVVRSQYCNMMRYNPDLFVSVYGKVGNANLAREVLQVPWMSGTEASQCIPPPFAEYIGNEVRRVLGV